MARTTARLAVVAVAATTALVGVGTSPAAAIGYRAATSTSWAYIDAGTPNRVYVDGAGDAPLGSWRDTAGTLHTARAYYSFDISALLGTEISEAELSGPETSANDCARRPAIELWRTKPVTNSSSWNRKPDDLKKVYTRAGDPSTPCPAPRLEWDALTAVKNAVAEGKSTLTLSLRLASGAERDPANGRHLANQLALSVRYNTPPSAGTDLLTMGQPCDTQAPYPWLGTGEVRVSALFTDADPSDHLTATFAVWPTDRPQQRVERQGFGLTGHSIWTDFDTETFGHGKTYAWQVRVTDGEATSKWSKACYFRKDLERPAATPIVSSADYPDDGQWHGGGGIPGVFRFDPNGVTDIVRYEYQIMGGGGIPVAADSRGRASVTITPESGPTNLTVQSIDKGGNRSDVTYYQFLASPTDPQIEGDLTQIGVPTPFTFRPGMPGVVEYDYRINDEPAITVDADADGVAHADVTARAGGQIDLVVTSRTAAGIESSARRFFYLESAPVITGDPYANNTKAGAPGVEGTFTFSPRMANVVRYVYSIDYEDQPPAAADAGGVATVRWTPQRAGGHYMVVRSVTADGTESDQASYWIEVLDPLPQITGSASEPGQEGTFYLSSEVADVVAFVYRFGDGAEQEVQADFGAAQIAYTPQYGGPHTLTVRSRTSDGTLSAPRVHEFEVNSEPTVVSEQYPELEISGFPGVEGTFTFTAPLPDVVEYRYDFEGEGFTTSAADEDGSATITWTPELAGGRYLIVVAVTATGFESQARAYFFSVGSANPYVESSDYGSWVGGGAGVPGVFTFGSRRTDVVEYEYWLNDGPHATVAAGDDGTASVEITPTQGFQNVVRVRSHTAAGVTSDVTEYYFVVDTAPTVSSETYPRDQESGGVGVAGEFVFQARLPGAVEFVYRFSDGVEYVRVPAGPDGTATVTHAPLWAGYNNLEVRSVTADGLDSHVESYTFYVPFS